MILLFFPETISRMAKTIIDAVMGLSFDDSPCNLASAALLYALTSDGQDEHLLESPSCIKFLIRLLKPVVSTATEEKVPKIGCKLLALSMGSGILKTSKETVDRGAGEILSKVHEILLSCKELKSSYGNSGMRKQELSPKWIALLTIEKACLSTISLEETSGTVRKSGGNFKEKLRELKGLDAVFEVAMNCHSDMESWMENNLPLSQDTKIDMDMQCLSLLLKCLKIMENATFLSKENQNHLLGMKRKITSTGSPLSFAQLVMSIIKILSDLYLLKTSAVASVNEKSSALLEGTSYSFEFDFKGDDNEKFLSDASKRNSDSIYSEKGFYKFQSSKFVSATRLECSSSETTSTSMNDSYSLKTRLKSSASSSCSGASRSLSGSMHAAKNSLRKNLDIAQGVYDLEGAKLEVLDDSQDPFAFDEDDFEPSKWEVLSGKQNIPRSKRIGLIDREPEYGFQSRTITSHEETSNGENNHLHEASCSTSVDEDGSSLLADCLLTAVKALMNVTNDNPVGCQQIATCGGLETMSSLIACHFPSFSSSSPSFVDLDSQNDRPLTDHELDFLVAILGLLVNLVEKDSQNRSRLASASVQLHNSELFDEGSSKDVIPLLCSIFLANQGAGEAVHEGKVLPWDDEEAVLQGEKEAEKMILEAYAALLLAFLSTESKLIRNAIADCLPDRSLAILVPVLDRFVAFHLSLNMITPETHKAVSEVIESCRGG